MPDEMLDRLVGAGHSPAPGDGTRSSRVRPVSRGMRAFLYAAIALTFAAGTQLVVLAEHTGAFFAWPIDAPLSAFLYLAPGDADSFWPWALTALTGKAIGTWLLGIGTLAAYVALRDDRADVPGASLSYVALALLLLLAVVRFGTDLDFAAASTWVFLGFVLSALAIGLAGAGLAMREHRFASGLPPGGVPVEVVAREAPVR